MKYPTANMPGVDMIIPDFDYLKNISHRVKGIIITHGHDDQYGALPYLLNVCRAPIYATETTINVIKAQYERQFKKINNVDFRIVKPSDTVNIAGHIFDLFQTTHSISDSFGFALKTKFGNIVYTSDFMTDYSPMKGYQFDLAKVARLSENEKTFLLMA
jgi:ribonuclease J